MSIPSLKVSDNGGELLLLGVIATGILGLLACIVGPFGIGGGGVKQTVVDMTPFLLVLQSIVSVVKDRWQARLQGQSQALLGQSGPANDNAPKSAVDAAQDTADAAQAKADAIEAKAG